MATILIADDEYESADFIRMGLEKKQHDVSIVTSGEAALIELKKQHYDLLILDLKMPGIGGAGVLGKRQDFPETKVIVLTAYPSLETAVSAVKNAADDYLFKPVNVPEIIKIVHGHLNRMAIGPYTVDMETESAFFKDTLLPLPPGLFDILVVFMRNPDRLLHHTDIASSLVRDPRTSSQHADLAALLAAGDDFKPQVIKYLRAQISRLRSELDKYLPDGMHAILMQKRKGFWWNPSLKRGGFD
jgi:DNA-binding response OmpR family regulator